MLHELRRALPELAEFVDIGPRTIRWLAGTSGWIDVVAFTDALARGQRETALDCDGGDLLPGCYHDWVLAERERLRGLVLDVLVDLATTANADCRDVDVVRYCRRLLRVDAPHEPTHRLLMEALARGGERSEAPRTYRRCVQTLARELGVAPEAATVELYDRLRRSAGASLSGSDEPHPALVGRAAEWRTAYAAWRAAVGGAARGSCW